MYFTGFADEAGADFDVQECTNAVVVGRKKAVTPRFLFFILACATVTLAVTAL